MVPCECMQFFTEPEANLPAPIAERKFGILDCPNHVAKDELPPIQQPASSLPETNHQSNLLQTG